MGRDRDRKKGSKSVSPSTGMVEAVTGEIMDATVGFDNSTNNTKENRKRNVY